MAEVAAPPDGFERARKRSVTIAGHETSIALEPVFWAALDAAAAERGLPLNALVAQVDALRIVHARPANLASALRTWLMRDAEEQMARMTCRSEAMEPLPPQTCSKLHQRSLEEDSVVRKAL